MRHRPLTKGPIDQLFDHLRGNRRNILKKDLQAEADHHKLDLWAERQARKHKQLLPLANKLLTCSRFTPCQSAICPRCAKHWQTALVHAVEQHFKTIPDGTKLLFVTIIPNEPYEPGELSSFNPTNFHRRMKYKLDRAGAIEAAGALDISLNEHKTNRYPRFWCPHYHGLVLVSDKRKFRRKLRKQVSSSDIILKPIDIRDWDGDPKLIHYIFKTELNRRRITFEGAQLSIEQEDQSGESGQGVRYDKLRNADQRELILALHRLGFSSRVSLSCLRLMMKQEKLILVSMGNRRRRMISG
jgi:hypothetical protein